MTQANILGLGWAATPAGLKAMEELGKLEEERRAAGGASSGQRTGAASAGERSGVRECESDGDCRTCDPGDGCEYAGGGDIL